MYSTWGDIENCEGWLSPGGHSSDGRALTAKVRGSWFNPGWLPVFHSSLKNIPKPFLMYRTTTITLTGRRAKG